MRLLQAADLLAWQSAKYMKDGLSAKRPPRKDFLSLMEHPHSLLYLGFKDGREELALEAWPLSRRSASTTVLTLNTDGPITLFYEDGDQLPIVPVAGALGWRIGGGRAAYIAFQDQGKKRFALSFDEMRLVEAILYLIRATQIYANGDLVPAIPASDIAVEVKGEDAVLRFKASGGGTLALYLEKGALEKLRLSLH